MTTRGGSLAVAAVFVLGTGCAADPSVDGFTPEVWEYLETFRLPAPPQFGCSATTQDCEAAAWLGQLLFFDTEYSDTVVADGSRAAVSCKTCHDPAIGFADNAPSSLGVGYTKRNTPGLTNLSYREAQGHRLLWDGGRTTSQAVIDVPIESAAALSTTGAALAARIESRYPGEYYTAFGSVQATGMAERAAEIYGNARIAFAAYQWQLVTGPSRFDLYLDEEIALTQSELRGLRLFLGFCTGCHNGHQFADHEFHNIGVPQVGDHAANVDYGRAGAEDMCKQVPTDCPDAVGKFRTPTLRNVALTGPYMHAGQLATLRDVIWFYRDGGGTTGFVGEQDAQMQRLPPLEDPAAVIDLEAFLIALTADVRCDLKEPDGICGN